MNMGSSYSNILFLAVLLNLCFIHGQTLCPVSFCGSSLLPIHYPFKFLGQSPYSNCTYFTLTCSNTTILSLPHAGDFYVHDVDYSGRSVQLYDPGKCLVRRFMNFSLESSPFKVATQDVYYTFYVCPLGSRVLRCSHVYYLGCLSNSTDITIATTRELSKYQMESFGCTDIGSWPIPGSRLQQSEVDSGLIYDFLFLTWDNITDHCEDCKENDDQESGSWGGKTMAKVVAVAFSMPVLIVTGLSCCSVFCLHLLRKLRDKWQADAADPITSIGAPQAAPVSLPYTANVNIGIDESKIMACTQVVVLSESDESIPSGNTNNTCSICLDNYCKEDRVRRISQCGHYFHASCIYQWLGKNGTCPVCRTSLTDNAS